MTEPRELQVWVDIHGAGNSHGLMSCLSLNFNGELELSSANKILRSKIMHEQRWARIVSWMAVRPCDVKAPHTQGQQRGKRQDKNRNTFCFEALKLWDGDELNGDKTNQNCDGPK